MTSISLHQSGRVRSGTRLWIAQGVLAALFLFAGVMKLVMPTAALAAQSHLPGAFMKFIGVAETLGALGLVLPGIFHLRERLTSVAAAGLVIIMVGAVITTIVQGQSGAIVPALVGVLAAYVARGRAARV
jgi:DoxX-like family